MSTEQKVMAAPTLQSAVTRYMNWRQIGQSAVDLIPEEIRRPPPRRDVDWAAGFIDGIGLVSEREAIEIFTTWHYAPARNQHARPTPPQVEYAPKLTLCTLAVRSIWNNNV